MKKLIITIIIILAVVTAWYVWANREKPEQNDEQNEIPTRENSEDMTNNLKPPAEQENVAGRIVVLKTSKGEIKITLDRDSAPKTANNFAYLASQGFYNGLIFHRVISTFVVQGGDPLGTGTGGPGYTIQAEINLSHKRGAVAMARLSDAINPQRESSGSQFYIALQDLPDLDGAYTVFGEVTEGMDVVDAIAAVQTDADDKPLEPVVIESVIIEN